MLYWHFRFVSNKILLNLYSDLAAVNITIGALVIIVIQFYSFLNNVLYKKQLFINGKKTKRLLIRVVVLIKS